MAAFTEIEGDFLRITAGLGGGGPRGVRAPTAGVRPCSRRCG